jgi:hypothetical protein
VTVIGKILNVTDRNTNMVLLVTDGTGELEINYWLQEETEQVRVQRFEGAEVLHMRLVFLHMGLVFLRMGLV